MQRSPARHDAVAFLVAAPALREALRAKLASAPDFMRALARLGLDRGGPRDLAALRDGLAASAAVALRLEAASDPPAAILAAYARLKRDDGVLEAKLAVALAEDLPLNRRDGGFIRAGFSAELDELKALRDESRRVIADMQARYADEAGIRQLKIKHNNMLGYYLETPQAAGEGLLRPPHNATFIHRQTMAGAMRFTTNALVELEAKIASAADRALKLELEMFAELARDASGAGGRPSRPRRRARRDRCRSRARRTRGQTRVDAAAGRPLARFPHRRAAGIPSSRRRSRRAASASSPTIATSRAARPRAAGWRSSPARTWPANRRSCARMR